MLLLHPQAHRKTYAPQGITATEYPTGTSFLISI